MEKLKFAVLPASGFGSALAVPLAKNGHEIILWFQSEDGDEQVDHFSHFHENKKRLAGQVFTENVTATADLEEAVLGADILIVAPQARYYGEVLRRLPKNDAIVLCGSKGFDPENNLKLSQVAMNIDPSLEGRYAVIGGPNFAREIAQRLPTTTVIASRSLAVRRRLQLAFNNSEFKVYANPDPVGVEVGGALKNPYAIIAGIAFGLYQSENGRAAVFTRSAKEMVKIGESLGGCKETFMNLSGLGDLFESCSGTRSRNYKAGLQIADGMSVAQIIDQGETVEGFDTAKAVLRLTQELDLATPLIEKLNEVLYLGLDPRIAARQLMEREPAEEY